MPIKVTPKQKSSLTGNNLTRYAIFTACVLVLFGTSTPAQSTPTLEQENRELQAAVSLMVRQLSTKDSKIQELRNRITQLESDTGITKILGCSLDNARKLIVEESFIYDREQALLKWLVDNVPNCKLPELEDLNSVASQYLLTQSRGVILRELAKRGVLQEQDMRGEKITEDALLGFPFLEP
tara:strand:+ start:255 stop:800 length:546 start_codon:yes stop_codon:yes gene_type:complete